MNLWECQHRHCSNEAVGIGEAIGLTAVGWYFKKGDSEMRLIACWMATLETK